MQQCLEEPGKNEPRNPKQEVVQRLLAGYTPMSSCFYHHCRRSVRQFGRPYLTHFAPVRTVQKLGAHSDCLVSCPSPHGMVVDVQDGLDEEEFDSLLRALAWPFGISFGKKTRGTAPPTFRPGYLLYRLFFDLYGRLSYHSY